MRKCLPILGSLLTLGCTLPGRHDPTLTTKPKIPYVDEVPAPEALSEGSLWRDRYVASDLRARGLNDLVTIRISESTSALSKADVGTSRDGANSLGAPLLFSRLGALGAGGGDAANKTSSTKNTYKGAGTTGRSATFTTTVTGRVVKVLGNGNIIFEGFRDIQLNNEQQRLYVAGILDPNRLDKNNSIASGQVAELRIGYGGQGVVDETLKPGYISRLLAYVWPF
jgi:flagellar L-ring protein FlgH